MPHWKIWRNSLSSWIAMVKIDEIARNFAFVGWRHFFYFSLSETDGSDENLQKTFKKYLFQREEKLTLQYFDCFITVVDKSYCQKFFCTIMLCCMLKADREYSFLWKSILQWKIQFHIPSFIKLIKVSIWIISFLSVSHHGSHI